MGDVLSPAASMAGQPFGMSAEQMLTYLANGEIRHPDATSELCGATDPREANKWCAEDLGHPGHHNNFRADDTIESYRARFNLPGPAGGVAS